MAEEVGFEPTVGCPTAVFKTAAIGHSATLPLTILRFLDSFGQAEDRQNEKKEKNAIFWTIFVCELII